MFSLDSLSPPLHPPDFSSHSPQKKWAAVPVPCNPALLQLALSKHALLLQGPVGHFFDRLTGWLRSHDTQVHRVVFQAGDCRDCQTLEPIKFEKSIAQWPAFLGDAIERLAIDCVVLFGQTRAHHAMAIELARARGVPVVVLEEGYVRPGYITMELDGVNGFSTTLSQYEWMPEFPSDRVTVQKPRHTEHQFRQMAWYACRHYWAMYWHSSPSSQYQHHKPTNIWHHSQYWVWSWVKKHLHLARDNARVQALRDVNYFFVPLQHDGDSQISHHSHYEENTAFIHEVLRSFAAHAPADATLVFRQHPHSRGGPGHARLISTLAHELRIAQRVVHLVEGHTPTIVSNAQGVVVINSTVGLQALMRNKPLAVLGEALYKQQGLCHQGPLDRFWTARPAPDPQHTRHFIEQLIALTQAPCNVYGRANEPLLWTLHTALP